MNNRQIKSPRGRGSRGLWLSGVALGALALCLASPAAKALTFTEGDLVVSVEGNGDGSASNGASATGNTGANATKRAKTQ